MNCTKQSRTPDLKQVPPTTHTSVPILEGPLRFLKIMLASSLQDKKLRIPPKFVRKFRHELSAAATLITPNGSDWQVGFTKDEKHVWFHDGWHDFVQYHSIFAGCLLVFEYQRNSKFHVLIYDLSACEISYPSKGEDQNSEFKDDMENGHCCGFATTSRRLQQQVEGKMEETTKINKPNENNEYDLLALLKEKEIYATPQCRHVLLAKGSERAMNLLRSFQPKNASFMIVLQSSNNSLRFVYISTKFAKKCSISHTKSVKVQVSDGKEWPIRVYSKQSGDFILAKGWNELVMAYNLKEGDICVFELIRIKQLLLKLSVFHA